MTAGLEALLAANRGFYEAFESLDLERMDEVWLEDPQVRCVHPGWGLLVGREAVRGSWKAIFRNTPSIQFIVADVHGECDGEIGWVSCTENIVQLSTGEPSFSSALTTNVFRWTPAGWRMVVHHASPILRTS